MEITWLGRNCFRLKGRDGTIVTDPCPPASGYKIAKLPAEIVTLSRRDDPGYSHTAIVTGSPKALDAPGEYEVGGILVEGVETTSAEGRNIAFVCELDGIRIGHLGLLDKSPASAVLEQLQDVDILLIPVGGGNALSGPAAQDVMTTIDPRIAIPMNFKTDLEKMDLEPLDRFIKETGAKSEPQPKYQVTRSGLPSDLSVIVLQPRP
jgi:L-ascorbate metabolism protein UlaG (beta-lactamase superfamily)